MARGWESKSIESQIESAESLRGHERPRFTPEQLRGIRERESIELQRSRILRDMAAASNPKYRDLLKKSLDFLDKKLRDCEY